MTPDEQKTVSLRSVRSDLFLLSTLALFVEMLLIRFMGTEVLIFQYFKNITLMSAFLGLGLGFLYSGSKRQFFAWSAFSLLVLNGILMLALLLGLTFLSYCDPLQCMLYYVAPGSGTGTNFPILNSIKALTVMFSLFALSAFSFVGLGQEMGKRFDQLRPLEAYSYNIGGSILGTALFAGLCYLQTGPGIWLAVAAVMYLIVKRTPSHVALLALGLVYVLWLGPWAARQVYGPDYVETMWSPYFRVDLVESKLPLKDKVVHLGYDVKVSYDTFQLLCDGDRAELNKVSPNLGNMAHSSNDRPYAIIHRVPRRVLILGAGNGSDAQSALDAGAEHVDAVDIDPVICGLGRTVHRSLPYKNPKVSVYNMDARTFLRNCHDKYDLIVFAYLDSHAAFSCMSSLRTDNYVFTKEAFGDATKLLRPNGLIYVSFLCFNDWLWDRYSKALALATGTTPRGFFTDSGATSAGYLVAGPGLSSADAPPISWPGRERAVRIDNKTELATDDWPFLFLPSKQFSTVYCLPLLLILLFSGVVIGRHLLTGRRETSNWIMLVLGIGFMLLEVRGMADVSLVFGSTWIVNTAVISAVLIFALVGNYIASKITADRATVILFALLAALVASNLVNVPELASLGGSFARIAAVAIYLFPVTFSSTYFSLTFKQSPSPASALAFNIFGGLIGVCVEYVSMWTGLRALGWIAVGVYLTVLLLSRWPQAKGETVSA